MEICHDHNLVGPKSARPALYGIRLSLPPEDTFNNILGAGWHTFHWYETAAERDRALEEISRQHQYSRSGDRPTLVLEKVTRSEVTAQR